MEKFQLKNLLVNELSQNEKLETNGGLLLASSSVFKWLADAVKLGINEAADFIDGFKDGIAPLTK